MIGEKAKIRVILGEKQIKEKQNLLKRLFYDIQKNLLVTIHPEGNNKLRVEYHGADGSFMDLIEIIERAKKIENPKKEKIMVVEDYSIFDPIGARRLVNYIEN